VNKLYSKLTAHEHAALVIEAAARLNESEADAISLPPNPFQNHAMPPGGCPDAGAADTIASLAASTPRPTSPTWPAVQFDPL